MGSPDRRSENVATGPQRQVDPGGGPPPGMQPRQRRDAPEYARVRLPQACERGRMRSRHGGGDRRRVALRGGARRRPFRRRLTPLRAPERPTGLRDGALQGACGTHPLLGPADGDLRHARARRRRGPPEGRSHPQLPQRQNRPFAGDIGGLPLLGRRRHRVRRQPGDDVPAAADGGPADAPELMGRP